MARTTAAILLGLTAATATALALPGCAYGVACTGGPEDPCGDADGGGGSRSRIPFPNPVPEADNVESARQDGRSFC
jgi:hypothetical protein